tara:strand:- start:17184 stop:18971 length:1788 start_codon:yes stop_codon:yes gene_type:complete
MTAPLIQGESGSRGDAISYSNINENNLDIYTFTADETVSWSITGGEKSLFSIDESTGKLSFKTSPDYEKTAILNGKTLKFTTNYASSSVGNTFFVELYDAQNLDNQTTPITANNFVQYVDDSAFDKTLIHRLVPDFVIQSGAYTLPLAASNTSDGHPLLVQSKGEIINEPGNSNLLGTISMAKVSGRPNSSTSQWFINLSDNKHLDSQNGGFTVFGHVLGDGIKNPLLLNNQKIYNVNYSNVGLNLPELPLLNLQGNIILETNYFGILKISTVDTRPSVIANKYNLIVSATDSEGNQSNQYVIVNVNDIQGEVLAGDNGIDILTGGIGNDVFQGNGGNDTINGGNDFDIATYTGDFSDYTFSIADKIVTVKDNRLGINDGIDTLTNIEKLSFDDKNALVTSKAIKAINSLGFRNEKVYSGKSDSYKFYDLGSDKYGVGTGNGIDELTGASLLRFEDKNLHLLNDIKATFDQVTGLNNASGQMFRLYNAAFARFPDSEGLKYWITNFSSGKDDSRAVASSFLASDEFKQRYGENVSNAKYVETLYINVLGRDYDQSGYNYWLSNLNNGIETRYELLLGFAESLENKGIFSEMTSLY